MALRPWLDDVRYWEFTPATIHYDIDLDAFYVARADIRSPAHCHHLVLVIAVTARDLIAYRITVQEAIALGRARLEQLIRQHRGDVALLQERALRVFDFAGVQLR
jgi:hypothetical protein